MAAGQQHRGECRLAPALVGLSGNILVPPRSGVKFACNRCTQYQMLPCVFWPGCKGGRAAAAGWQLRGEHITRIGLCKDAFCAHTKRLRAGDACNRFEEEKTESSVNTITLILCGGAYSVMDYLRVGLR